LAALLLTAMEMVLATSVALFFGAIASPILSAVFTVCVFALGYLSDDLLTLAMAEGNAVQQSLAKAVVAILPAFHHFDVRNHLLSGIPVPAEHLVHCALYASLYTAALLLVTIAVFRLRDFE
jgi:hypothetical protein